MAGSTIACENVDPLAFFATPEDIKSHCNEPTPKYINQYWTAFVQTQAGLSGPVKREYRKVGNLRFCFMNLY
jgi:hypothetical protein